MSGKRFVKVIPLKETRLMYAPVLHFLISVVSNWQVLIEAVVGGVAR